MNYRDFLQKVIYVIINPVIKAMIRLHITPNIVTFIGFIGNIVAAGFFVDISLLQMCGGTACRWHPVHRCTSRLLTKYRTKHE